MAYRTSLGTRFYDRSSELEELDRTLREARTIILYGPRGVGKSELARYYLAAYAPSRGEEFAALIVDVRRAAAEHLGVAGDEGRRLLEAAFRLLFGGRAAALAELVEAVAGALRRLRGRLLVLVDEFHLLYGDAREALRVLEAVAGYLAKRPGLGVRLLLTVSEGFVATSEARRRLVGYASRMMLIEGMAEGDARLLHREYSAIHGCSLDFDDYWAVYGGAPGYLPEACSLDPRRLYSEVLPRMLYDVVDAALEKLAVERGVERRRLLEDAASIIAWIVEGEPRRLEPRLKTLAEKLVEANVLYPCVTRTESGYAELYLPQLPVYGAALTEAAERHLDSVSALDAEALRDATRRWKQPRCAELRRELGA